MTLRCDKNAYIITTVIIFLANQHKAAGMKTEVKNANCCNGTLFWDHTVAEGNCISSLISDGAGEMFPVFSVTVLMQLLISCVRSIAMLCHLSAMSTAKS